MVSLCLLNLAVLLLSFFSIACERVQSSSQYQEHQSSYCSSTHCSGAKCSGTTYTNATSTFSECQNRCMEEKCQCFQWRDPGNKSNISPDEPACITTNLSSRVSRSEYGYTAWTVPSSRNTLYQIRGAIEVDTNENTLFLWHGSMYVLENIPCYYSQHASRWDPSFANASYARIRDFSSGAIVTNLSLTIGFGFISAYVDEDTDTVWLFGSACNRCSDASNHGCVSGRRVQGWSNRKNRSALTSWDSMVVGGTYETYNVEVTRVRSSTAQQKAVGLPPHTHAMIMEIGRNRFALVNAPDGDLSKGWFSIPGATEPPLNGGPSIRWNPLDSMYYCILGGTHVELIRTLDFRTWERSPHRPFIQPEPADGFIAPFAGFPSVAKERGFLPMHNDTRRWDWNSNDADVCCITSKKSDSLHSDNSFVIWGAGTQGKKPDPPLTKANHCANVVGTSNLSLPELLAKHFMS